MPTKIHDASYAALSPGELLAWAKIPVTIVSDVSNGAVAVDPRIRPLRSFPLGSRMVGQAVTAWCERADLGAMLLAIDAARAGEIVVADAGGCLQTAYVGEILSGAARLRKLGGLIVNGAVRDIDTIASWDDFPVFSLGSTAKGPLSKERGAVNGNVVFGGVAASPGDVVLGDNDGLAIIPLAQSSTLLRLAEARVEVEARWAADLAAGKTLAEVFGLDG